MSWEEIKGQEQALGLLRRSQAEGRLAHAYIFSGPEGVGKKMTAELMACSLVCESANPPCGQCGACFRARSGRHPDINILVPLGKSRIITRDQVTQMLEIARLNPSQGNWKIFIIDDAETLGQESANHLLKFLEEPQEGTLIVLVTSRLDLLLPTVISRCQVVRFRPWPAALLREFISQRYPLCEGSDLLVRLAQGSPGHLVDLIEDEIMDSRSFILDLVSRCRKGENPGSLASALVKHLSHKEKNSGNKEDLRPKTQIGFAQGEQKYREAQEASVRITLRRLVLDLILIWYRDLYLFNETGQENIIANRDRIDEIRGALSSYSRREAEEAFELLEKARESLFRRNTPAELVLEGVFAGLAGLSGPPKGEK